VTGHGCAACEHADEVVGEPATEERRGGPLGDVQKRDGEAELEAERPPDVGRADVPAAERADVDAADEPRQPVPPRQRAEEVAGRDQERFSQA
jgi:hypothetical protein